MTPAPNPSGDDNDRPRSAALEVARHLHAQAARGHSGVVVVVDRTAAASPGPSEAPRRIGLRGGLVYAIDAGPSAPVSPELQLRYILRQRGRPEFQPGERLSARFAVNELRPDLPIRQHVEAQALSPESLRARIGSRRVAVVTPPHQSVLHPEELAVIRFLAEPHTIPELYAEGARAGAFSPLRAMRLLVLLDALGSLLVGEQLVGGQLAEAYSLLGLDPAATLDEVKAAYRRLARLLHPDSRPSLDAGGPEHRELTARFTALHAAYRLVLARLGG